MKTTPDDSRWDDPSVFIPGAGLIWPWVVAAMILFGIGVYLLIPMQQDDRPARIWTRPPVADGTPHPNVSKDRWTFAFVDSPTSTFAEVVHKFAQRVAKETDGRVKIEVIPNSGAELDLLKQLQAGDLQMALITSSPLTNISKNFEVLDLPFLFRDFHHADQVLLGPIGDELMGGLEKKGLKALATLEIGFRIFTSTKPLPELAEFQNKRIRVMQSTTAIDMARLMGGKAVPSPVNKIYEMAKSGYIDAADRTYPTFWDFKLYEVMKYVTDSRHSYSVKVVLCNLAALDTLSPEDRKVVETAARDMQAVQRKLQRAEDQRVKEQCKASGITVYELTDEQRRQFVNACDELYEKCSTPELLKKIQETAREPQATP